MIKMFLVFILVCIIVNFGIECFTAMSGKARWKLAKRLMYATMVASVSICFISFVYIVF